MASDFDKLPQELLTLIAEELILDPSNTEAPGYGLYVSSAPCYCFRATTSSQRHRAAVHLFRDLRLVLRSFTYLRRVLQFVFNSVKLRADRESFDLVEKMDFLSFAEYVKQVTFIPPEHSVAMTFDIFVDIILAQSPVKDSVLRNMWKDRDSPSYIRERMVEALPFGDATLRIGFQRYMDTAEYESKLLRSDRLRKGWSSRLRTFTGCYSIRIISPPFNSSLKPTEDAHLTVRPHRHDRMHSLLTCQRLTGPLWDQAFGAALDSIVSSGLGIHILDISGVMTGELCLTDLECWNLLDLSKLHTLTFRADLIERPYGSFANEMYDVAAERTADALTDIIRKCSASLISLTCRNSWPPMPWPPNEVVRMPSLHDLNLVCGFRATNLPAWMRHMPSLKSLLLQNAFDTDDHNSWFKMIVDALKDHIRIHKPRRMLLEVNEANVNPQSILDLYLSIDLVNVDESTITHDVAHDRDSALAVSRYVSGLAEWDHHALG